MTICCNKWLTCWIHVIVPDQIGTKPKVCPNLQSVQRVEFYDHFNQIRDMVPKTAEHVESVEFYRWSMAFCPRNRYNIIY
ncbi:hypothetical protein H5410_005128 [Solanum commersonii]|uniref:Uncharacterized protein n=1 Tax=Solanum commersonii TaxID=4109 RepID=A0A9J6A5K1_SOLCO|nr:hypothetical protein H5410_005128 [Solanum commersonii]